MLKLIVFVEFVIVLAESGTQKPSQVPSLVGYGMDPVTEGYDPYDSFFGMIKTTVPPVETTTADQITTKIETTTVQARVKNDKF